MQLEITFRRMEPSEAIKTYVNEKLLKMKKYLGAPMHARVVLTSERLRNKADVILTLPNGLFIKGVDTSEDMYFSIDQAVHRIEKQVRKYKEKIQSHKPINKPALKFKSHLIEHTNEDLDVEENEMETTNDVTSISHKIVRTNEYEAEPLTIESALMKLELQDKQFLVFTNANTNNINVLYRKEDGKFGLISTNK